MDKIQALIMRKDQISVDEFMEVYRRIQAEDKIMMNNENHDEYDICAMMGKLINDPDASAKLQYIIDRAYELWNHRIRMDRQRINAIHTNVKLENVSLQP